MIVPRTGKVAYINTAPCDDCGVAIDYIRQSWYPLYPDGALCRACGEARGLTGVMPALDVLNADRDDA